MSLIIKMDAIKTEEHLRKSIPYIMNEKKTGGLCFSNSGITSEQIVDTFFLTKQIHPTLGTRQGYHFKFSFSKDETMEGEQALLFIKDWVDEYLTENYDYACSVHKDREHMHMHLVAAAPNGVYLEKLFMFDEVVKSVYLNAPEPVNGIMTIPEKPGLGLELNMD